MSKSNVVHTVPPRWGSIEQTAEHLGVHPRTVRRMIAEGRLTGFRLGSRIVRIDLNEVDDLLRPIPSTKGVGA